MNLWVRSQDKTIFQKVDNLLISDGDNAEGTFNIYTNLLPVQNVLGKYKTKEIIDMNIGRLSPLCGLKCLMGVLNRCFLIIIYHKINKGAR